MVFHPGSEVLNDDDDAEIEAQVDNPMFQRPELIKSSFRKVVLLSNY